MAKIVSKIYGEALFELAKEEGRLSELYEETIQLQKILTENPEFDALMKHPGIAKQEKLALCDKIFQGRVSDELAGLLKTVISKERYGDLPAVFAYFIDGIKAEKGIGVAYITTAAVLSESRRQDTVKRLLETTDYREIEPHFAVDESLIGGMVIRIGDRVVDSSIRTKLNDLTRQLLKIQLG